MFYIPLFYLIFNIFDLKYTTPDYAVFGKNLLISNEINIINNKYENEYREYGPLKVKLRKIGIKNNNVIYQAYNNNNQPIYIAISCKYKEINVTNSVLSWRGWFKPEKQFELKMINDLCSFSLLHS